MVYFTPEHVPGSCTRIVRNDGRSDLTQKTIHPNVF
jgi:hypothetical protein